MSAREGDIKHLLLPPTHQDHLSPGQVRSKKERNKNLESKKENNQKPCSGGGILDFENITKKNSTNYIKLLLSQRNDSMHKNSNHD